MEFDSPEAAKDFPGLYMADSGKADDSIEYGDDGDKKKNKKEKKKDKDKGYSTLAAESSQDEDDSLDPKSPGKGKKIKAFSKLSGKKKEKDKKSEKTEKELTKKAEKEAKEKRKSEEKERKSIEKELNSTPGPSASAPRPQIPFSGAHLMRNNSLHYHHNQSAVLSPQSSIDLGTPVKRNILNDAMKESTPSKPPKEKSAAFNVFLNAPAPLLSKLKDKDKDKDKDSAKEKSGKKEPKDKDKKHKDKDKEKEKDKSEGKSKKEKDKKDKDHSHASGMAKVKLKLMRSKNSLEDTSGDLPHITSHQFPEDPDSLAKEIKKYEGLLEQAHTQLKSSKKISKKQEEQLWELQRTLTQLKRKLRSINALSCASAYHIHTHSSNSERPPPEPSISPAHHPIFKKCDSIDGHALPKNIVNNNDLKTVGPTEVGVVSVKEKEPQPSSAPIPIPVQGSSNNVHEIPKIPMPPSKSSYTKADVAIPATSPTKVTSPQQAQQPAINENSSSHTNNEESSPPAALSPVNSGVTVPESINNFASPRPSVDTIVQVHRSSVEEDVSDIEEPQLDDDTENDMEDLREEDTSTSRIRSISNDSQEEEKENIEAVLDDANKMIGSMHEELMFEDDLHAIAAGNSMLRNNSDNLNDSGSRTQEEESDVELFTNDLELDPDANLPNEETCPDPFSMPVFDTAEYLSIENEALLLFNEQLKDDIFKEQTELEEALQRVPVKVENNQEDESPEESNEEKDSPDLIAVWTKLKSENEVLWENVNRLRVALATCKVDEFRLQTRLNYLEARTSVLSPVTTTTPLQTEG